MIEEVKDIPALYITMLISYPEGFESRGAYAW
jgi:hypothetical protein